MVDKAKTDAINASRQADETKNLPVPQAIAHGGVEGSAYLDLEVEVKNLYPIVTPLRCENLGQFEHP